MPHLGIAFETFARDLTCLSKFHFIIWICGINLWFLSFEIPCRKRWAREYLNNDDENTDMWCWPFHALRWMWILPSIECCSIFRVSQYFFYTLFPTFELLESQASAGHILYEAHWGAIVVNWPQPYDLIADKVITMGLVDPLKWHFLLVNWVSVSWTFNVIQFPTHEKSIRLFT